MVRQTDTPFAVGVYGELVSVSASVVRVTLIASWTDDDEWTLVPSQSSGYEPDSRMLMFAFIAGTEGEIVTSTTPIPAKVFS
jgi:hypothetical protein